MNKKDVIIRIRMSKDEFDQMLMKKQDASTSGFVRSLIQEAIKQEP